MTQNENPKIQKLLKFYDIYLSPILNKVKLSYN